MLSYLRRVPRWLLLVGCAALALGLPGGSNARPPTAKDKDKTAVYAYTLGKRTEGPGVKPNHFYGRLEVKPADGPAPDSNEFVFLVPWGVVSPVLALGGGAYRLKSSDGGQTFYHTNTFWSGGGGLDVAVSPSVTRRSRRPCCCRSIQSSPSGACPARRGAPGSKARRAVHA